MIGNLSKSKCKIYKTIRTIEISKDLSKLIYNLIHIHGISCGVGVSLDYICDTDVTEETIDELREELNNDFKEKIMAVAKKIQETLNIGNKFFICDIDKNIINIFEINYDEFLDNRGFISEDFTKAILTM